MSIQDMHERLKKANEQRNCGADEEIARLRAVNAELVEAMQILISSCGSIKSEAIAKARAAIFRAEQAKQESDKLKEVKK